jgi:hypothetical protein
VSIDCCVQVVQASPLPVVEPVEEPVLEPVEEPVLEPVVLPVVEPVVLPVVEPVVLPVVDPVEPVVPPPQSEAHSLVQAVLQRQSPTLLYSVTAVLPAVVWQVFSQLVSPAAQLLRQVMKPLQAESLLQVLYADAHWPPLPNAVCWQVSQLEPPVVPPVEPVEPVVPPPHSEAHWVEQAEQPQVWIAFKRSWLACGAALTQPFSQVESPAVQLLRQLLSVTQPESLLQAVTCEAQAPLDPCASLKQVLQSMPPEVVPPVLVVEPVVPVVLVEPPPVIAHQLVTEVTAAAQSLQELHAKAVPSLPT